MSQRIAKINKQARSILSEEIQALKDPRIGFVTLTSVRVSTDLRHARILVSVLGDDEERTATMAGLTSAKSHLRSRLGHEMRLRYVPELDFVLDTGAEEAAHLEGIFKKIHEEDRGVKMVRYSVPDWDPAVEALRSAGSVAIACHVNPDGDALGSLLAAALGLNSLGKTVHSTWPAEPPEVPQGFSFLPGLDTIVAPGDLPDADVYLALDCGAGDRLGALEDRFRAAAMSINVDHHPGNDAFAKFNIVVETASSTAELVAGLLLDLGVEITTDIATCLYTGIVTDTGNFQYTNASADTLRLAADLLDHDVPKTEISQQVYQTAPFGFLRLVGLVLSRAELISEQRLVYSMVTHEDLRATGVRMEETDSLIDLLRSTRDADVAAIFKEQGDGAFRVSMRSKRGINVGAIARANGGGGHDLAAGFSTADVEVAVKNIASRLASD